MDSTVKEVLAKIVDDLEEIATTLGAVESLTLSRLQLNPGEKLNALELARTKLASHFAEMRERLKLLQ